MSRETGRFQSTQKFWAFGALMAPLRVTGFCGHLHRHRHCHCVELVVCLLCFCVGIASAAKPEILGPPLCGLPQALNLCYDPVPPEVTFQHSAVLTSSSRVCFSYIHGGDTLRNSELLQFFPPGPANPDFLLEFTTNNGEGKSGWVVGDWSRGSYWYQNNNYGTTSMSGLGSAGVEHEVCVEIVANKFVLTLDGTLISLHERSFQNASRFPIGRQVPFWLHGFNPTYASGCTAIDLQITSASWLPAGLPCPPTEGLVAHWPFSGDASDATGLGHDGTLLGNAVLAPDRFGNPNRACLLDGSSSSYVRVQASGLLQLDDSLTVCAWLFVDGGYSQPRVLSYGDDNRNGYRLAIPGAPGARAFRWYYAGGAALSQPHTEQQWHHVCGMGTRTEVHVFVNGFEEGSHDGYLTKTPNWGGELNIGRKSMSAYDAWGGLLDDIRIYNRTLSDAEIFELFVAEGGYHQNSTRVIGTPTASTTGSSTTAPSASATTTSSGATRSTGSFTTAPSAIDTTTTSSSTTPGSSGTGAGSFTSAFTEFATTGPRPTAPTSLRGQGAEVDSGSSEFPGSVAAVVGWALALVFLIALCSILIATHRRQAVTSRELFDWLVEEADVAPKFARHACKHLQREEISTVHALKAIDDAELHTMGLHIGTLELIREALGRPQPGTPSSSSSGSESSSSSFTAGSSA
jgi:Concanavalin A-like lectin/glucanases superfamily